MKDAGKAAAPTHLFDLKKGQYSDGSPLDEVHYLESKIILKPDRFTSAKVFLEFGELIQGACRKCGVAFSRKGVVLKPQLREVLFLDTADFTLYKNAFILRRRILYQDGFPVGDPEIVFKFRHPDIQTAAEMDVRPDFAGDYRIKFKAEGLAAARPGRRLSPAVLAQRAVRAQPDARGGAELDVGVGTDAASPAGVEGAGRRAGRHRQRHNRRGGAAEPRQPRSRRRHRRRGECRTLARTVGAAADLR
jgi:hypothetical protein